MACCGKTSQENKFKCPNKSKIAYLSCIIYTDDDWGLRAPQRSKLFGVHLYRIIYTVWQHLTLFLVGGGGFRSPPPSGFSCAIANRLDKARENFLTFKGHALLTSDILWNFWPKVRSADPPSKNFATTPWLSSSRIRVKLTGKQVISTYNMCVSELGYWARS